VLQPSPDANLGRGGERQTLGLEHLRPDDHVADAGFVFQAQEDHSSGVFRPLAGDDHSGDLDRLTVTQLRQFAQRDDPKGKANSSSPNWKNSKAWSRSPATSTARSPVPCSNRGSRARRGGWSNYRRRWAARTFTLNSSALQRHTGTGG